MYREDSQPSSYRCIIHTFFMYGSQLPVIALATWCLLLLSEHQTPGPSPSPSPQPPSPSPPPSNDQESKNDGTLNKVKVVVPVIAGVLGGLGALFGMSYTAWKWRARHKVLKMEPMKLSLAKFGSSGSSNKVEVPQHGPDEV